MHYILNSMKGEFSDSLNNNNNNNSNDDDDENTITKK